MADFDTLKIDVAALTGNRSDLAALEATKINAAIRMISLSGKYWRDLQEVTLDSTDGVVATTYTQSITLPARFRATAYLSYVDPVANPHITGKDIGQIVTKAGASDTDIFYLSGTLLHIRNSILSSTFLYGYYDYPIDLSAGTDTNWVTDIMPALVADLAASIVLSILGNKESTAAVQAMATGQLSLLVPDLLNSFENNVESGR